MFERYPDLELQLQLTHFEPSQPRPQPPRLNLSLDHLEAVYVYGLSDGYPFLEMEEWLEAVSGRHLIFLEDELEALHRLKAMAWGGKLLKHPQVHLKFLHRPIDLTLELCAKEFPFDKIDVATHKKKSKRFHSMKLALLRKTFLWHSVVSECLSGHLLHRNIFTNLKRLPRSFYVNKTKNAFAGKPAVICGAGPSLDTVIGDLKQMQDKALIIGCGSALSALSHAHVKPHLAIAFDPNAREKECVKGHRFKDVPLIYGNRLYPEVFEFFEGPCGYFRSPSVSPLERAIEEQLGLSEDDIGQDLGREALSVTTLALSLACFWGCSPIILAGVDLAYSNKQHYAPGVTAHVPLPEHVIYRKGAQGKRVATLIKWVMEQETIDAYTKRYPHLVFLNATGQGLGFASIPHRPFSAITLPSTPIDVQHMIASHPTPVTDDQLSNTVAEFKESFERCLDYTKRLREEKEGSGKAILYEEELAQEKVYSLTLQPALSMLERVFQLNIETPFSSHKWRFLQEAIESYLEAMK